jgi:TPR repeat protein
LYERGWGVAQDYGEAMGWYRRSADQQLDEAQNNI